MLETFATLYKSFFGAGVVVAPEYLLLSLPIAWIIYKTARPGTGFWRWLTPAEIYFHKSHKLDLILFAIGRLMVFSGILGRISLTTLIAVWVARVIPWSAPGTAMHPMLLTLLMWLISDVTSYWVHRIHHQISVLWPLHAVHHSAEVLTPFTAYRQHPLVIFSSLLPGSILVGIGQGALIGTFDPNALIVTIAGVNTFILLANLAMANFHHSHIWVSFGPLLERIIISPAQHQIHHSTRPEHFDKNFGQTLALWDWIFGSLYVIRDTEQPTFGISDADYAPLATHKIGPSLWHPVKRIYDIVIRQNR